MYKPAIVVVAYNRQKSLERLLNSLLVSDYSLHDDITLVISIDKNNNTQVYDLADNFNWPYGEKHVIKNIEHLGLRKHILKCGELTKDYNSIILLEDDLFVSPYFYDYTVQALNYYDNDEKIAGISLYNYTFNETARRPFEPIDDGSDVYFVQIASSWGQAWSKKQWDSFISWYETLDHKRELGNYLPTNIISWPDSSWKKYFIKYMIDNNKYFVYPRVSLTTNFGEIGTHHKNETKRFQVPILLNKKTYELRVLSKSIAVYDVFFEILPEIIKRLNPLLNSFDFEVDLYGTKNANIINKRYILTSQSCKKIFKSFGRTMKPHELSLIFNSEGNYFKLAECSDIIQEENKNNSKFNDILYDSPFIVPADSKTLFYGYIKNKLNRYIDKIKG